MALWQRVHQMQEARDLYGPHFPLDIRHNFAELIETQGWENQDIGVEDARSKATALLQAIQGKIRSMESNNDPNMQLRFTLQQFSQNFQSSYITDPMSLARLLRLCLGKEKEYAQRSSPISMEGQRSTIDTGKGMLVLSTIKQATLQMQEVSQAVSEIEQQQEHFIVEYQELFKLDQYIKSLEVQIQQFQMQPQQAQNLQYTQQQYTVARQQKQQVDARLGTAASELLTKRNAPYQQLSNVVEQLKSAHLAIIEQIDEWHKASVQGTASTEAQADMLSTAQQWAEEQVNVLFMLRHHLRSLYFRQTQLPLNPNGEPQYSQLIVLATQLLLQLVQKCFVIEVQPPRVLKTQTKFSAQVRMLIGDQLRMYLQDVEVSALILNERQVIETQKEIEARCRGETVPDSTLQSCAEIINSRKSLSHSPHKRTLTAGFKNMSMKKIKRGDTRNDCVVTEEKFSLAFRASFSLCNGEVNFNLCTMSSPIVIVVHGNQIANAEATILWDNSFAKPNRLGFEVPMATTWKTLAPALSLFFSNKVGSSLNDIQLNFLASMLGVADADQEITWRRFNKTPVPGKQFSFWEWFYSTVEVLDKARLLTIWNKGLIQGYISKEQGNQLLSSKPTGSFLIRFSQSELGALSVMWVGTGEDGANQVWNLQPWTLKDFTIRPLADRLKDLPDLIFLLNGNSKDNAFSSFYSAEQPAQASSADDYVRAGIHAVVIKPTQDIERDTYVPSSLFNTNTQTTIAPTSTSNTSWISQLPLDDLNVSSMDFDT